MGETYLQVMSIALPNTVWEKLKIKADSEGKKLKYYVAEEIRKMVDRANVEIEEGAYEPDPYIPSFSDINEAIEFKQYQTQLVADYFAISEVGNFQMWRMIGSFINLLMSKKKLGAFFDQFNSYKKIRDIMKKPPPTITRFLGKEEQNFTNGEWCRENWMNKLNILVEHEKSKHKSKSKTVNEDYKQSLINRLTGQG
jgi:hypothetical protein